MINYAPIRSCNHSLFLGESRMSWTSYMERIVGKGIINRTTAPLRPIPIS